MQNRLSQRLPTERTSKSADTGVAQLPSTLYGTWLFPSTKEGDVSKEVRLVFYNDADSVEGKVREIAPGVFFRYSAISATDKQETTNRFMRDSGKGEEDARVDPMRSWTNHGTLSKRRLTFPPDTDP